MPSYSEAPKPHFGEVSNYFYVDPQATLAEAARQFDIANHMYLDSPIKENAKQRYLANHAAYQAHHFPSRQAEAWAKHVAERQVACDKYRSP